ncbi:hypothetical protein HUN08_05495 [Gordonia sp. X0973]|uniref:hypothetical protein n=1 Tax=Gordonia sp. X0973 TaxID=2742602 RepID=UPI000F5430BA|nr:hypothetical protein [Gordonia sp. X0973]QKT06702.1 hypothetical protein HUN08_05495 [Gordonia sp. X0973]
MDSEKNRTRRSKPRHAAPWTWSSFASRTIEGFGHALYWRMENFLTGLPSIVAFVAGLFAGSAVAG